MAETSINFEKLRRRKTGSAREPSSSNNNDVVKNGRLIVALLISVCVMLGLSYAAFSLSRDRSAASRILGGFKYAKSIAPADVKEHAGVAVVKQPEAGAPELTFYTSLSADEPSAGRKACEAEPSAQVAPVSATGEDGSARSERDRKNPRQAPSSGNGEVQPPPDSPHKPSISRSGAGEKIYTVQVGAFSHPSIAQEWALKWKARGYEVSLKPVARPGTGVIYRLYLGNFSSEKSADDLVKRLKSKEGITALRLMVRN
jgi:cell division septation protein DedD